MEAGDDDNSGGFDEEEQAVGEAPDPCAALPSIDNGKAEWRGGDGLYGVFHCLGKA